MGGSPYLRSSKRGGAWPVAVLAFGLLTAVLLGLALAGLPLSFGLGVSGLFIGFVVVLIVWLLPPFRNVPDRLLLWGLLSSLFLYFVWPRNAFIPIAALPIKHPQKLLYLSFFGIWLISCFKSSELRARIRENLRGHRLIVVLFWILVALRLGSVAVSKEVGYSFLRVTDEMLVQFALFPIVLSVVHTPRDVRLLVTTLVAAACCNAALALPEAALKRNLFERVITLDTLDPVTARQIIVAKFRGGSYRAQASFDHPLLFAEFLAMSLPFAAMSILRPGWRRSLWVIATLAICAGLVLARSRSAFGAALVVAAALAMLIVFRNMTSAQRSPWPLVFTIFVIPLLAVAGVAVVELLGGLVSGSGHEEYSSSASRIQMLGIGLPLVAEKPLMGHGAALGAYTLGFANTMNVLTLDNYFLSIALDSGVIYLAAYLLFGAAGMMIAARTGRSPLNDVAEYSIAICASLGGFYAMKAVLGTPLNNGLLFVMVALALVLNRFAQTRNHAQISPTVMRPALLVTLGGHGSYPFTLKNGVRR